MGIKERIKIVKVNWINRAIKPPKKVINADMLMIIGYAAWVSKMGRLRIALRGRVPIMCRYTNRRR